jgi:hypothetical protein
MARKLILALASTAALLCAGAAHANSVTWTIGINAPGIGTVISNAPVYRAAPIYVPAPVVYEEPAPVVYQQPRVVYQQPQVVYQQPQVVYRPVPRIYAPAPVIVVRPEAVVYQRGPSQWVPPGQRREWNGGRYDQRRWHHMGDDRRDPRDSRSN